MKIAIIGTGYVGLVAGACFAQTGNTVTCVDHNQEKIKKLNEGVIPIYEPSLHEIVVENLAKKRLFFTADLVGSMNQADVIFIAVGTPQGDDGAVEMAAVFAVCEEMARSAKKPLLVGVKSTVPVGTGDAIETVFKEKSKFPCTIFSNPEFLKEGDAVADFMKPSRVILGVNDTAIVPLLSELYAPFMHQRSRLMVMTRKSAEVTKYAANGMLAIRISFMNEMAGFCEAVGANIHDVRAGIGSDPRIGSAFLYPGLGFGGSCFPKDVKALVKVAKDFHTEMKVLNACDKANIEQPEIFFQKILRSFGGPEKMVGKKIAVWGGAFKANTDDIRESPALKLVDKLLAAGAMIHLNDPAALENIKLAYGEKIFYNTDYRSCLTTADALVVATEWNEYRSPDWQVVKAAMRGKKIFDARNLYERTFMESLGFEYQGVGS
jgi:UDPglucose 6-dehydrogenase